MSPKILRNQVATPDTFTPDTFSAGSRSKPSDTLTAYQESARRRQASMDWIAENLPECVGSHQGFAAHAARTLRRHGRPLNPETVRAQMRLMWPKLETQVTERGGVFDPEKEEA